MPLPATTITLSQAEEKSIQRVLALELLPLDDRSILLMFLLHADSMLKAATSGFAKAEDVGGNWMDYITFTGVGSELQSHLDPKWSPLLEEAA